MPLGLTAAAAHRGSKNAANVPFGRVGGTEAIASTGAILVFGQRSGATGAYEQMRCALKVRSGS